ncbi:MAG: NYN domain-containing protein [Dehalococcoidia bacterium]|nr:NYN domain-containing protein [Dehalococcoidia bacterium]
MKRIIAYVDGFNLYFGLRSRGWRRYYWLDIHLLAQNLMKPDQQLLLAKYFTARIAGPPDKEARQSAYIAALETLVDLQIFYGKYQINPRQCARCGFQDEVPNEKMTDVNIAVELLKDAYQDRFDTALLISADSDLVPPVQAVRELFRDKRVIVASPPGRYSAALARSADGSFIIGRANLARSLLADEVENTDGRVLRCPPSWR